jgi:hypothetical protein
LSRRALKPERDQLLRPLRFSPAVDSGDRPGLIMRIA